MANAVVVEISGCQRILKISNSYLSNVVSDERSVININC